MVNHHPHGNAYRKTRPGFTLTSDKYNLMFMTANQIGIDARDLQRDVDWRQVMKLILNEADIAGDDFDKMKREVRDRLMETVCLTSNVPPRINIFDEPFFPRPKGHMRRIAISLFERHSTTIEFSLARRNALKTLKDIALNAVTSNVKNSLLINKMEVPEPLKMTLRKEFYNDWARKRFPSYNIYLLPYADSLKRKQEISKMEEKESKYRKSNISLHRVRN